MQKMPDMKGIKLHVAASISWHHKWPLTFYNDEHDAPEIQVHKPRKPRKSKNVRVLRSPDIRLASIR